MATPAVVTAALVLPYAAVLAVPAVPTWVERALAVALAVVLGWLLATAGGNDAVYTAVWNGLRPLTPLAALAACVTLAGRRMAAPLDARGRQIVFLLAAVASLVSLVQFPYAFGIYFCYAAPLVALALAAVVEVRSTPRLAHLVVLAFYFGFAVLWMNTGFVQALGLRYIADAQINVMSLPRSSLTVYGDRKHEYERIAALVNAYAKSEYIWAAPDAPEVYFLTAKRNPTRTIFDIFDEPDGRTARILAALDAHDVTIVVLNTKPNFSPATMDPELAAGLAARFPRAEMVGRFQVRWRS
jgi:hypothetical protein